MSEKSISQEFRLKNIDKTKNYFLEKIKENEFIRKKHRKVCQVLNYIDQLLVVISTITGCVSVSACVSLAGVPIGITNFANGLKKYAITPGIKKYK